MGSPTILRKISADEITWGKILKKIVVAWHGKILFYNSKRIKKCQLHHATKPCSYKGIHHFVENNVISYEVIAC